MAHPAQGAIARIVPKSVNYAFTSGPLYQIEGSERSLLDAGIIADRHVPGRGCKQPMEDGGVWKCGRLKSGEIYVHIRATAIIDQDRAFKRFIGDILADTRLSLVKGEKPCE